MSTLSTLLNCRLIGSDLIILVQLQIDRKRCKQTVRSNKLETPRMLAAAPKNRIDQFGVAVAVVVFVAVVLVLVLVVLVLVVVGGAASLLWCEDWSGSQ
jgi:hypothetical protein